MERIRGGEFNTTGKEFELVSDQAKKLIEGRQTSPKFLVGNIAHKNGRSTATSQHARLQFEIASFRFADRWPETKTHYRRTEKQWLDSDSVEVQLRHTSSHSRRAGSQRDVHVQREDAADRHHGRLSQGSPRGIPSAGCDEGATGTAPQNEAFIGREK